LSSHQRINPSRQKPESARSTMRVFGHRARTCQTMRSTSSIAAAAPSMFAGRSFAASRCTPQWM
jgi:hypothetical protein